MFKKLFNSLFRRTPIMKVRFDHGPKENAEKTFVFIHGIAASYKTFKSTLDEVREADLLIHVVDISHPNFEEQYEVVEQTINELLTKETEIKESDPWSKKQQSARKSEKTVAQIPRIVVFNKVDAFTYTPKEEDDLTPIKRENISLEELKKTWMAKLHDDCIFISAREKTNIDELKALFYDRIKAIHIQRYPYNDFLFQHYE